MKCNDEEKAKEDEKKYKSENSDKSCECDDTPAKAGEGKKADDAATEELDKKSGKRTSNDSGALAGPNTKPTIRNIDPAQKEK